MSALVTLFLCGDLMSGRGIDQILPESNAPVLMESYVRDARDYVALAEQQNGPIPDTVDHRYPWGDALAILDEIRPAARVINLETSVTTSDAFWPGKGVHYRMHPANTELLKVAEIDCCVLANNHVIDFGFGGLLETLESLRRARIAIAGAGETEIAAASPAILPIRPNIRLAVFGYGARSSGVPESWAANRKSAGVNFLPDLSPRTAMEVIEHVKRHTRPEDIVVFSVHWGSNWGYHVPDEQVDFAHLLIDSGAVDLIHGHSSHHVRPLEVYRGKLILYGAGDFINDYEGITGYEALRDDLTLMYFPTIDPETGRLIRLQMVPLQIWRFRLRRAAAADALWLSEMLNEESERFGTQVAVANGRLELRLSSEQR